MATHGAPADGTRETPETQEPEYLRYGFSIVGVQKSGTTTLASTLKRHPQIAPAPRKEMTFFINERHDWSDPPYDEKYRLQRKRPRHLVVGDSTPAYLFWPHALERMHAYNPDMRLIAIFRDPIERAFSHWSMIRHRRPDTTYDWPETLERYPATELPAELPPDPGPNRFRSEGSVLARGFYGAQLERGFGIFPREQWLLLEFRAMLADFQGTLDRITDHIGIRRYRKEQPLRQAMASAEVIYGTAPTADDITALAEGYAADLALFRRLSGLDVSRWPTVQVVAGELDPGDFAAKLARKVRPVEERPTLSAPAAELDAEPAE